ncbi:putative Melanotransferrin [Hypsibius exemplaris]|uniref:Melanotransferrin n=1 Tax=Hypsibius exemplaris TaxID=2072580 RepID=A0A1W0W8Z4_HYPEX|nr:putative Melanotransferrin [Hypsibius exemplaris]
MALFGVLFLVGLGLTAAQYQPYQQQNQQQPQQSSYGSPSQSYGGQSSQGSQSWNSQPQQQQNPYGAQDPYNSRPGQVNNNNNNNPNFYNNAGGGVGANPNSRAGVPFRFCTVTDEEQQFCQTMIYQLAQNNMRSAALPGARQKRRDSVRFSYTCVRAVDKLECMKWVGMTQPKADVVLVTPGEAYVGRDHGLIPLAYERIGQEGSYFEDQVVAVIRADRNINDVGALRGKSACFGPVGDSTWDHVMAFLRTSQTGLSTPPCNGNYMDSAQGFFGDMCAPYDIRKFSDAENARYAKVCSLCSQSCAVVPNMPADFALNCFLQNERVDVAFLQASVLRQAISSGSFPQPHMYQVLCPQSETGPLPLVQQVQGGFTRSVQEWSECYLGRTPTNVWLTRQGIENFEDMTQRLFEIFTSGGGNTLQPNGAPSPRSQWLDLFFTGRYSDNQRVTRFTMVRGIGNTPEEMDKYLSGFTQYIEDKVSCSLQEKAKWCTTSKADQERCLVMQKAFKAYRLRPELECEIPVKNSYVCLEKIQQNKTDLALIDIGDLVTAGNYYNAIQIAQERYLVQDPQSGSSGPIDELYSVAIVRDAGIKSLADLRGKRACFTGLWEAQGFMLPMDAIKKQVNGDYSDGRHLQTAEDFFGDSCLPGLADGEPINFKNEQPKDKLCRQCEGGQTGCSRGGDKKYTGPLGALKCLRDGKGDVAFVPHTVLSEIPQTEKQSFYLVCNGAFQSLDSYASCNQGKAPGSVLVTNRYKQPQEKRRLQEMILTASQLFSSDLSSQYQPGGNAQSLTSSGSDRSRRTFKMFGKRNRTDINQYGPINSGQFNFPAPGAAGPNSWSSNPTAVGVFPIPVAVWTDPAEYAIFGPSAYDLRSFGDLNTTSVGDALQSFLTIGERSDWKRWYETGHGSRLSAAGVTMMFLFGLLSRVLLL